MQSESVTAAAPAAANAWGAVGIIPVPAGVKSLKQVKIGVAPDPGVLAATVHLAPVFRITGSGLQEQNPHQYVAQGSDCVLIAATTALINCQPAVQIYDVDIPVATGGPILIETMSIAEVVPGSARAELVFSPDAAAAGNSMSDFVTAVMPAAPAAWVAVGILVVPQLSGGGNPKRIKRIDCGLVMDNLAAVTSLRTSIRFRMTGSGIAEPGNHMFLGNQASGSNVVTGSGCYDRMIVTHFCDVPVNPGGAILVEAIMDVELTDGGDSVFGVQYA